MTPHHQELKAGLEAKSFGALVIAKIMENESYIISA